MLPGLIHQCSLSKQRRPPREQVWMTFWHIILVMVAIFAKR